MNDDPIAPQGGNQLAVEAAEWFAQLRGPDAEAHRPAFEAWLARGAVHLAAYNRAAEIYNMGKFLAEESKERSGTATAEPAVFEASAETGSQRGWSMRAAIAGVVVVLFAVGAWLALANVPPADETSKLMMTHGGPQPAGPLQIASRLGEIRTVPLSDGSRVTLDSDTLVSVSFGPSQRRLRLERGRARFEVAHDGRPFVVAAGSGTVTARGTIFDVSLSDKHKVSVKLIRGLVDVDMPADRSHATATPRRLVQLRPGDEIAYADAPPAEPQPQEDKGDPWTDAMAQFDQAPLREVIARANAVSPVKIRIADRSVGDIRISGSFKVNDGAELARRLALLFDLRVDDSNQMEVVLHRR